MSEFICLLLAIAILCQKGLAQTRVDPAIQSILMAAQQTQAPPSQINQSQSFNSQPLSPLTPSDPFQSFNFSPFQPFQSSTTQQTQQSQPQSRRTDSLVQSILQSSQTIPQPVINTPNISNAQTGTTPILPSERILAKDPLITSILKSAQQLPTPQPIQPIQNNSQSGSSQIQQILRQAQQTPVSNQNSPPSNNQSQQQQQQSNTFTSPKIDPQIEAILNFAQKTPTQSLNSLTNSQSQQTTPQPQTPPKRDPNARDPQVLAILDWAKMTAQQNINAQKSNTTNLIPPPKPLNLLTQGQSITKPQIVFNSKDPQVLAVLKWASQTPTESINSQILNNNQSRSLSANISIAQAQAQTQKTGSVPTTTRDPNAKDPGVLAILSWAKQTPQQSIDSAIKNSSKQVNSQADSKSSQNKTDEKQKDPEVLSILKWASQTPAENIDSNIQNQSIQASTAFLNQASNKNQSKRQDPQVLAILAKARAVPQQNTSEAAKSQNSPVKLKDPQVLDILIKAKTIPKQNLIIPQTNIIPASPNPENTTITPDTKQKQKAKDPQVLAILFKAGQISFQEFIGNFSTPNNNVTNATSNATVSNTSLKNQSKKGNNTQENNKVQEKVRDPQIQAILAKARQVPQSAINQTLVQASNSTNQANATNATNGKNQSININSTQAQSNGTKKKVRDPQVLAILFRAGQIPIQEIIGNTTSTSNNNASIQTNNSSALTAPVSNETKANINATTQPPKIKDAQILAILARANQIPGQSLLPAQPSQISSQQPQPQNISIDVPHANTNSSTNQTQTQQLKIQKVPQMTVNGEQKIAVPGKQSNNTTQVLTPPALPVLPTIQEDQTVQVPHSNTSGTKNNMQDKINIVQRESPITFKSKDPEVLAILMWAQQIPSDTLTPPPSLTAALNPQIPQSQAAASQQLLSQTSKSAQNTGKSPTATSATSSTNLRSEPLKPSTSISIANPPAQLPINDPALQTTSIAAATTTISQAK